MYRQPRALLKTYSAEPWPPVHTPVKARVDRLRPVTVHKTNWFAPLCFWVKPLKESLFRKRRERENL